ncbi:CapA family protein [Sanguibacter sp. A247]|uniref:CapA family protein n=1 Tax=unclassified Sanguibacter TaxID=2645534 RepID=UPI003FD77B12
MRHAQNHAAHGTRRPRRVALVTTLVLVVGGGVAAALTLPDLFDSRPPGTSAATTTTPGAAPTPSPSRSPQPTPEPTPDVDLTILAAGDVLPHTPVMTSARTGDGYDFRPLLAGLDAWVQGADLALCHMEVPVAPTGRPVSGYPMFGTTPALVRDLAAQGWDGCSTASNHSVDKGFAGLARTLDVFDAEGLGHVGTARSSSESLQAQRYVLETKDQTTVVAHLSGTYGTNGMPVDADKPWSVTMLDAEEMISAAHRARAEGADVVLVSMHAGSEYVTAPTEQQRELAQALADSGEVDLLIGHHAHVPQPFAKLTGGPDGAGMWVGYGLGNMVSNQDGNCCSAQTANGLLMIATVHRSAGGPAHVTGVEWAGITVDRLGGHRIHAFADLDGPVGRLSEKTLGSRLKDVEEAVDSTAPERREPPIATATVTVEPRPGSTD